MAVLSKSIWVLAFALATVLAEDPDPEPEESDPTWKIGVVTLGLITCVARCSCGAPLQLALSRRDAHGPADALRLSRSRLALARSVDVSFPPLRTAAFSSSSP